MKGAAHVLQMIEPADVDIHRQMQAFHQKPDDDDSSVEGTTSGDDSIEERPPPKKLPHERTQEDQVARQSAWETQLQRWEADVARANMGAGRNDFMFLEYVEGGTLHTLVKRLREDAPGKRVSMIPNRVLWSLWLCSKSRRLSMEYPISLTCVISGEILRSDEISSQEVSSEPCEAV